MEPVRKTIGVLALQGAFREHRRMLEGLGADTRLVRWPSELERLDGLVIPGGESTAIAKLLAIHGMYGAWRCSARPRTASRWPSAKAARWPRRSIPSSPTIPACMLSSWSASSGREEPLLRCRGVSNRGSALDEFCYNEDEGRRATKREEREPMSKGVTCPACGAVGLDVCRYESMMVVRADLAMFTLRCPHCKATVSSMQPIPPQLYEEVRFAALEVGAGMGLE